MIERLSIQNLILIDCADIHFGPGLNIITGETGAGKSAILTAIRLILGERADIQWIAKGADLAIVEATVRSKLMIDEILFPSPFIIRRELHRSGRSRCFIEDQQVTLQQLRALPIELIDQSASAKLSANESQRELLDNYAELAPFTPHFNALRFAQKKLSDLLELQKTSQIEQQRMEEDLTFIEEINWREEEEESLLESHNLLAHSEELLGKTEELTSFFSEGSQPLLPTLKRYTYQLESLKKIEPKFEECAEWLKIATLNLEEASHFLISYGSNLETDPNRLFAIEKRLGEIESIKRRFGSFDQVEQRRMSLKERTAQLSNLDTSIQEASQELSSIETTVLAIARERSEARHKAATTFSASIISELKSLNLMEARFTVELKPKNVCEHGVDEIRYLFAANPGQPLLPLDQGASGGELSRILFALKIALGTKEGSTCLIFDEIDSNVGGKTAAILGMKLEQLAALRQIICVTHFVQVAKYAMEHFLVSKTTTKDSAITSVQKLDAPSRLSEYERMTGAI
jgi:DNA repair protein RecN (Recombination protein N)